MAGLVEIFLDGIWGRINYDGATSIDARSVDSLDTIHMVTSRGNLLYMCICADG